MDGGVAIEAVRPRVDAVGATTAPPLDLEATRLWAAALQCRVARRHVFGLIREVEQLRASAASFETLQVDVTQ